MNKVILVGRFARDLELRTTNTGKAGRDNLPVSRQRPTNCSNRAITVSLL